MIVYGNHEVPDAAQMMCQLTDMLWMRARSEQKVEQTFRSLHDQIADLESKAEALHAETRGWIQKYGDAQAQITSLEDRAIEAEQDRDSWKAAYETLLESSHGTAVLNGWKAVESALNDGRRSVDPFGKDGVEKGPYGGLGGTMQTKEN